MRQRALAVATVLIWSAILLAGTVLPLLGAPYDGDAQGKPADPGLFGLTRVVPLHIEIPADEYRAMQPPTPAAFGGPPPAPRSKKPGERASERNLFGVEFPWARGAVMAEGKTFRGRRPPLCGERLLHGLRRGPEAFLPCRSGSRRSAEFHGLHAMQLQGGALTRRKHARPSPSPSSARPESPRRARRSPRSRSPSPASIEKAYLGLYTLVEPVDRAFLKDRFGTDKGLLVRPQGLRGLDFLGDDWEQYSGPYRPLAEPTPDEARRLIEFVRLVHQGNDEQFRKEIDSYLDVDRFLRFMAAQALIANADGFFALAYNYSLFLDPNTNQFVFLPGDQELAFANFLMMGSADQLMDMSLTHPYGGQNRLADRLLAIQDVREAHRKLLKDLATTVFRKDRLLADVAAIEAATKAILEREAAARAERAEPPVGFGPPGAPTAPDLRTFAEKRSLSIADQLAGQEGRLSSAIRLRPPGRGAPPKPVDDKTIGEVVKAPPGFEVTLFAAPPKVGYPVALSVAPDGAVYVAVDEQGSLGRTPGGGRVVRCIDEDGDGKADRVNVFAKMDHPRGVIAQDGKVWVLHPPMLSVFHDDDGDGTSDRQDVLVSGLTTSLIDERGGDHTTNGIRMGLDGWIYIAVGDYGFHGAKGKDGTRSRNAAAASSASGPTAPSWRSSPSACATRSTSPSTRS